MGVNYRLKRNMKIVETGTYEDVCLMLEHYEEEIKKVYNEGKCCRNEFRMQCLAQEYNRLIAEYKDLNDEYNRLSELGYYDEDE